MITIYCYKCGFKVDEVVKGKYQKGAKGICKDCLDKQKINDATEKLSNLGNSNKHSGLFNELFGGK